MISYVLFIASNSNKDKNIIRVATNNSDLIFTFSKNNLLVFSYEIRSFNETKENSLEYKKIVGETLEKNTNAITIKDYKKKDLKINQPYYFSISREGFHNESGVALQSINFCIKANHSVYTEKNEDVFIKNCINN